MYAWRSIYWSEQVSARTRALLMFDWIIRFVDLSRLSFEADRNRRGVWGRDLSRL